jgi:pyruvate kinase
MIYSTILGLACLTVISAFNLNLAARPSILKHVSQNKATLRMSVTSIDPSVGITVLPERFRKATKQLATLGPASSSFEMIEKLFLSGADIFRLNFSHGEHKQKADLVDIIRAVEKKYDHPIAILADLQGPKLRVGVFADDKVLLVDGQTFVFDMNEELGDAYRVRLPHPEILNTLGAGDFLLLDDGKLKMEVMATTMESDGLEAGKVTCKVIVGGALSNRKGVNTPTIIIPMSPMTAKDRTDLTFALTLSIDWVALSFVQKPEDIVELRKLAGPTIKLMAKLEKPSAIDYLDEIVSLADGIMVARGDLGVEMNPWDVPVIQKRIVETCKILGKPVVIATQMLESMIDNPTPTRAEASDCATAIYDSADAVMLSAESAAGKYPVEAVTMQQLIINKVEADEVYASNLDRYTRELFNLRSSKDATNTAITLAARQVADISNSKAILAFTTSGSTALRVSKLRPTVPVIAVTYSIETARWLAMVWGVYPIVIAEPKPEEYNIRDEIMKACVKVC